MGGWPTWGGVILTRSHWSIYVWEERANCLPPLSQQVPPQQNPHLSPILGRPVINLA